MECYFRVVPEGYGGIGGAQMVVSKKINKRFAFVAKAEDESAATECSIGFHDVPQNRLLSNRNHWLWQ